MKYNNMFICGDEGRDETAEILAGCRLTEFLTFPITPSAAQKNPGKAGERLRQHPDS
jgi:hypothetical protein